MIDYLFIYYRCYMGSKTSKLVTKADHQEPHLPREPDAQFAYKSDEKNLTIPDEER